VTKPDARDPFDLARFVEAQERDYEVALSELEAGRKRTHWIWYVLPQLRGLGTSRMSQAYGIASLAEARAYLAHPVLGSRLRQCVEVLNALPGTSSAAEILGAIDAMKLRSCLTLFNEVEGPQSPFAEALGRFFRGDSDPRTLELLAEKRRHRNAEDL
jgi:uncharacterized protein (DUF1810 family)